MGDGQGARLKITMIGRVSLIKLQFNRVHELRRTESNHMERLAIMEEKPS